MYGRRIIAVSGLLCCMLSIASAQLKIIPKKQLEQFVNPTLSSDSVALRFDTERIVAPLMSEDDVPGTFVYGFENVSDGIVRIKRIATTCSCVTAVCSSMQIAPGERAEITVRYDPKGHPGKFERRIFVYTQEGNAPVVILNLAVEVENGADLSGIWKIPMGTIRLRRKEVSFVKGTKGVETLRFINVSGKPLKSECDRMLLPACMEVSFEPETVQNGEEGTIVIEYDPAKGIGRDKMQVILKGTGLPPSQSSISVLLKGF